MNLSERFWYGVVDFLPKTLVKYCVLRVWAHATVRVHHDKTPDQVNVWDALKAWGCK